MFKGKRLVIIALLLCLTMVLSACGSQTKPEQQPETDAKTGSSYKETLRIGKSVDIESVDPHNGSGSASIRGFLMLYLLIPVDAGI